MAPNHEMIERIRAALLEGCKAPSGTSTPEITSAHGFDDEMVASVAWRAEKKGLVHRAKISHRVVRWFDTAERAAAYVTSSRRKPVIGPRTKAPWGHDAPMVIPPGVKVQRIPTPPAALWTNTHARW